MTDRKTELDGVAMAVMVVLCASWGLQQVAIKFAHAGVSPALQAGIRSAGATVLLYLWMRARRVPLFNRDGTLIAGIAAGLLFAGEFLLIYWGLLYTAASRSVIFLYTAPFVVAVGAHLFIPGERIRAVQAAGLASAFIGVLVAFADSLALPTGLQYVGDLMLLAAAVLWGATTVLIKASTLARIAASKTLFYQLAASAIALPLASLALNEPGVTDMSPTVIASLVYQTVGVAFVSYLAWFWLISRYPASRLSSFSFLTPLLGALAGWLVLDEPVTVRLVLAMALVGLGIYLVNRPQPATAPVSA